MKLAEYLDSGRYKRVRLIVHHGLGDAIMFSGAVLRSLRKHYPDIDFVMDTHNGQPAIFGTPDGVFDLEYRFNMPCAEWEAGPLTKSEKCLAEEVGIDSVGEDYSLDRKFRNPFVSVHWTSTCNNAISVPEPIARKIWDTIIRSGLIPIDTNCRHIASAKATPPWATRRLDDLPLSPLTPAAAIAHSGGFAGCSSGNFWLALSVLPPEKILFVATEFSVRKETHLKVHELDLRGGKCYCEATVQKWLEDVKK